MATLWDSAQLWKTYWESLNLYVHPVVLKPGTTEWITEWTCVPVHDEAVVEHPYIDGYWE